MDLPAEPQIRWILRTTATLLDLGAEPVRGLIQPNGDFFPDTFDASPRAAAAVLARVQEHAALADTKIALNIITPEGEARAGGGCSSGACATPSTGNGEKFERVTLLADGGYLVSVAAAELRHPVVLTTAFVRAISFIFLTEAGAWESLQPRDREPAIDLAAILLGFGVLVANGSYIYAKGCGGVQVHSATRMPVDEVTLALAIFCRLHQIPDRTAMRHLELTPRAHFEESAVWTASNTSLLKLLRDDPARIAADGYDLSESRSWLARVLGIGVRRAPTLDDELVAFERSLPQGRPRTPALSQNPAQKAKLAELRALVDESLES
ncbi:hypothetical protein [Chondromyces apiculatus]|uniref:Uncharacterized protein n=1 Tax=Chondromyces apiculatus DSM 436 TaxID=1192034 RepID=A0A017SXV7_9BACT|nr:hypothetical protein [Chondromyces apiculatus]EYF01567.1 Hypothetical protein CAP_8007 [Chondromyces apiculatus DSM 436]